MIEDGLAAGEKVVVVGIQRVRDGATVTPEAADMADFTASALTVARQEASRTATPSGNTSESATQ